MTVANVSKYFCKLPLLLALAWGLLLASCEASATPSPAPSASAVNSFTCPAGDHALQEIGLGWSFCYPSDWRYREKFQPSTAPRGVDTTLDVVVVAPTPGPDQGEFGFVIVGSYETGGLTSLDAWVAKYVGPGLTLDKISWGNATSAAQIDGQLVRVAMTADRVYLLDIHQGAGNLAVDDAMKARLGAWRFGA